MIFKGLITAAAAVALAATPALAAAGSTRAPAPTPAKEKVKGSELGSTGIIIAVIAAVAAAGGIWAIADNGKDSPVSP